MPRDFIKIRLAQASDAPEIVTVRYDTIHNIKYASYDRAALDEWAGHVDAQRIEQLLSNDADIRIVAEIDKRVVGYGELVTAKNLLSACYVTSYASGQGVGGQIVSALEKMARQKSLHYLHLESSANAEKFYEACGYRVIERGKHTMKSGATMDCVMMRKDF